MLGDRRKPPATAGGDRGSGSSAALITTLICVLAVAASLWAIFRSDSAVSVPLVARTDVAVPDATPPTSPLAESTSVESTVQLPTISVESTPPASVSTVEPGAETADAGAAPATNSGGSTSTEVLGSVTPTVEDDVSGQGLPSVQAASWVVFDAQSEQVLSAHHANEQRPIGSIQKLLSIAVALDDGPLDNPVTVPRMTIDPKESVIGLRAGEVLNRDVLIRAMLIVSANDAARALAIDVAGDQEQFVERMNSLADRLGMSNTVAKNPHGLDVDGQHSTANDVLTVARTVMTNADVRQWVQRRQARLHGMSFDATNPLFGVYRGADGIKTGSTTNAGYCFVASATRDGRQIYVVVLGSPSKQARLDDTRALLDWAFAQSPDPTN